MTEQTKNVLWSIPTIVLGLGALWLLWNASAIIEALRVTAIVGGAR